MSLIVHHFNGRQARHMSCLCRGIFSCGDVFVFVCPSFMKFVCLPVCLLYVCLLCILCICSLVVLLSVCYIVVCFVFLWCLFLYFLNMKCFIFRNLWKKPLFFATVFNCLYFPGLLQVKIFLVSRDLKWNKKIKHLLTSNSQMAYWSLYSFMG